MRQSLVFLGLLALLFIAPAAHGCDAVPARPVINVTMSEQRADFDLSKSMAELSAMEIDTQSPYPARYHQDVGGVMSGEITLEHNIGFSHGVDEETGKGCVYMRTVDVKIDLDPTIFIASDFHDQACWFKEIFEHETQHVAVDRALMEKYVGQVTDGLNLLLFEPADYAVEGIAQEDIEFVSYQMQDGIERALKVLFDKMLHERMERQSAVDSVDEYKRLGRSCPASS